MDIRRIVRLLLLWWCGFSSFWVNAQIAIMPESDSFFESRVSLISEFIDRFNGVKHHPNVSAQENDRRLDLQSLLDFEWIGQADIETQSCVREMIDSIMTSNLMIAYSDTSWCARALCNVAVSGSPTKIEVCLRVEPRDSLSNKWSITEVKGNVLELVPPPTKHYPFIIPSAHETHFVELVRVSTDRPKFASAYLSNSKKIDSTSVFFALVVSGQLKIMSVEDVVFTFSQVPGFTFDVKYVNRESSNSGWLITSVSQN